MKGEEEKPWQKLQQGFEGQVWIFAYQPKTQKEIVEAIYGKPAKQINQKPVIRARRFLVQHGYIERIPLEDARKIQLSAKGKPVLEWLKESSKNLISTSAVYDPEKKYLLTPAEENIIIKILESNWFRQFIFFTREMYPHFNHCFKYNGKRIISSPLEFTAKVLGTIGLLSFIIQKNAKTLGLPPELTQLSIEDLLSPIQNFDEFATNWVNIHLSKNMQESLKKRLTLNILETLLSPFAQYALIKYISDLKLLAIPAELAEKVWRFSEISYSVSMAMLSHLSKRPPEDLYEIYTKALGDKPPEKVTPEDVIEFHSQVVAMYE